MAGQESVARIRMLDDTIHSYDIKVKCYGNVLYQMVLKDLQVLEADFFGIQYPDKDGAMVFLEPMKRIKKQIENINNVVMQFVVKFFPPDPGQLQEEYTRYLFALQVKQDLIKSMLPCNESTMVMMSSYVVQSDFGDWDSVACGDLSYLKDFPIMNGEWASPDIFKKVADQHKAQIGQTPADADFHLLDIVRRLDHYGLRLHSAKDQENASINLAVAHMGVIVFRGNAKINTFNWARIRKLSFKKKRFLVKLRIAEQTSEGVNSTVGDVLVFVMPSRDICKSFWRLCIEYHAFFRLDVHPQPKPQALLIKRGSTFRYTGKTQKELHELVRHSNFQRSAFTRASSRKQTSSSYKSSPQPLNLPGASASKKTYEDPRYNSGDFVPSPIKATSEVNGRAFASPDVGEKSPSFSETNYNENSSVAAEQNAVEQNWRVESKNLHSNSGKVNQSEGNQHVGAPDIISNCVVAVSNNHVTNPSSYSNTNDKSSAESSLDSRSSLGKSSSSLRSLPPPPSPPREDTSYPESLPSPPPLPPKTMRSPVLEVKVPPRELTDEKPAYVNMQRPKSESRYSKSILQDVLNGDLSLALSASEVSIPGIAAGEPISPGQFAALEKKLIKTGFYSVPSNPPDVNGDASDIDKALHELEVATESLNFASGSLDDLDDSNNGMYGVVVDSEEDLRDIQKSPGQRRVSMLNDSLLTPIPMNFSDFYKGPDYETNILSSFSTEMENSFNRIKQSLSVDSLGKSNNVPLSSSMDVLSMSDVNSFCHVPNTANNNTSQC